VLFSSIPSNGLSTTVHIGLKLTDRYMRDFVALQDIKAPEPLADNIELTTWDSSKGEAPEKVLMSLIRKDPNGIVVNHLPNAEVVKMLCQQALGEKLIVATVQAKEAVETLLRVLLMKVPADLFASAVTAVVNQRLVRKLCEHCKEAYEPAPALLQKLGIPAGRIESVYRPPEIGEKDKICTECNGVGYMGRTAIFELLVMNDELRDALIKQPKLEVLRNVARKTGNRNLQQEGVLLVAQGITSLAEVSRVLKQ
jgi:type II secretory ATPase GspE/PulE/Tfp pilus assembly ATPase PilB-like protein